MCIICADPVLTYPRDHLRIAIGAFYFFFAFAGFCLSAGRWLDSSRDLAALGIASSAVMWWTLDSMQRRREIPFASLWIGFAFWMITLPVHVLATRPRPRAMKMIALHGFLAVAAFIAGIVVGLIALPEF